MTTPQSAAARTNALANIGSRALETSLFSALFADNLSTVTRDGLALIHVDTINGRTNALAVIDELRHRNRA